jgi:hypothetical protein
VPIPPRRKESLEDRARRIAETCGLEPIYVRAGSFTEWERTHVASSRPATDSARSCTDAVTLDEFLAADPAIRCAWLGIWGRHEIDGPCRARADVRAEAEALGREVEGDDPLGWAGTVLQEQPGRQPCLHNWTAEQWAALPESLKQKLQTLLREKGIDVPCASAQN